ncbi:MAG: hypothetical protein JXQ87_18820 [Bacteroidia bacterium]
MPTHFKLRNTLGFVLLIGAITLFGACEPDDKPEQVYGKLVINVINQVDDERIVLDEIKYENAAGNVYGVTRLQYYLSNFQFSSKDCEDFVPENSYHLISLANDPNLGDPNNDFLWENTTIAYDIPAGCYDDFTFSIGVDPDRNANGPYTGDLDFSYSMNWSWSGDYIFFKNEGKFIDNNNEEQNFIFHIGNENMYKTLSPFTFDNPFEILEGETITINLYANLNEFFANPNNIDLNRRSGTMSPGTLADSISTNYIDMFTYEIN